MSRGEETSHAQQAEHAQQAWHAKQGSLKNSQWAAQRTSGEGKCTVLGAGSSVGLWLLGLQHQRAIGSAAELSTVGANCPASLHIMSPASGLLAAVHPGHWSGLAGHAHSGRAAGQWYYSPSLKNQGCGPASRMSCASSAVTWPPPSCRVVGNQKIVHLTVVKQDRIKKVVHAAAAGGSFQPGGHSKGGSNGQAAGRAPGAALPVHCSGFTTATRTVSRKMCSP